MGAGPKIYVPTLFVLGAGPKMCITTLFVLSVNRSGPNCNKSESINELNKINQIVVKSYKNKLNQRNKT